MYQALEISGTVLTFLDATIRIVKSVHDAVADAKDLPAVLASHDKEIAAVKAVVASVCKEPGLQNDANVTDAVKSIGAGALAVQKHLSSLGGRSQFQEIGHQLLRGTKDRETLNKLMQNLSNAKDNLLALISIFNVGISSQIEEKMTEILNLPTGGLTDQRETKRIITRNEVSGRGFMMNAPVVSSGSGENLWKDIYEVRIEDNKAADQGVMLNHPATIQILEQMANNVLAKIQRLD